MIGEADGKHPILPVSHVHTWAGCTGCPTLKDCEICGLGRHPKLHNSSAPQPAPSSHLSAGKADPTRYMSEEQRKYILSFKEEDPLLMAYVEGQKAAEQRIAGVIAATRPILESLEWSGTHDFGDEDNWAVLTKDICPYCYGRKKNGHKPDCKLGKAISLLRGDGKP